MIEELPYYLVGFWAVPAMLVIVGLVAWAMDRVTKGKQT